MSHINQEITKKRTQEQSEISPKEQKRKRRKVQHIVERSEQISSFHKRIEGLFKKSYELKILTGAHVLLFVVSDTGQGYAFVTPKLRPVLTTQHGISMLENCLNGDSIQEEVNTTARLV